ncbi:MAG: hypothetical protein JWL84_4610 [Rhodospirillales bacterium]|nr:hypothetical protein [Rhodospirillales bacterium]
MRRPTRLILLIALPLIAAAAAYGAYWFYVAGLVRDAIVDWAAARRVEGITVGWDSYAIAGFPGAIRVTIEAPVFSNSTATPGYEARGAQLTGEASPWSPRQWRIEAPQGAQIAIQPGPDRAAVTIAAARLGGTIAPPAQDGDGMPIALTAEQITMVADARVTASRAAIRAILPGRKVSHQEVWFTSTIAVDDLGLAAAVEPLGQTIAHVDAGIAVKGTIPSGPRPAALAAWRDDGGTLELQSLGLLWGKLALAATGTISLDAAMQPLGALTARIGGYNEIIDALVAANTMRPGDAQFAKIALGVLARPGADGKPELDAPITLQNGFLFIGPARLARLPHFTWE